MMTFIFQRFIDISLISTQCSRNSISILWNSHLDSCTNSLTSQRVMGTVWTWCTWSFNVLEYIIISFTYSLMKQFRYSCRTLLTRVWKNAEVLVSSNSITRYSNSSYYCVLNAVFHFSSSVIHTRLKTSFRFSLMKILALNSQFNILSTYEKTVWFLMIRTLSSQ